MAKPGTHSPRIFAVVLAAGRARRYGATKQLVHLPGADESLVRRASRLAVETCGDRVLLVAGHDAAAVVADAVEECGFVVVNERHADGLGTSVACAVRTLTHAADALLLMLADQPYISASHLAGLVAVWTGDARHVVATAFGDDIGAPALLPSGTFARLAALGGDTGAKAVFGDDDVLLTTLRFDAAAIDIDSPDDLESLAQVVE